MKHNGSNVTRSVRDKQSWAVISVADIIVFAGFSLSGEKFMSGEYLNE